MSKVKIDSIKTRYLIKKAGYSLTVFANEAGLSTTTLANGFKSGKITERTLELICNELKINTEIILKED
jgi:lambda repressor-like predicted transcriptional regulator